LVTNATNQIAMLSEFREFSAVFPWFFPMWVGILGACIGSFLNVVIYRVPAEKSVVRPGSHCACGVPIRWYDNIPVLSWLILRGRARCCGRAFSFRYPFVELLTAGLFLVCWLRFSPIIAFCGWIFLSALLCATFIDLDHMIIPDVFTLGLGVIGIGLSVFIPELHGQQSGLYAVDCLRSGAISLLGLLIGSGFLLWFALLAEVILKKEAMGFGDVKFIGAIGAFCGWEGAIFSIFGGAIVGLVWFSIAWIWQKLSGKSSPVAPRAETPDGQPAALGLGVHIPFGPMLAIAGAIYFLWGRPLVAAWIAELTAIF
jgi:leader peptidase (prepilin peptidase) / N-methyltransferase